MQRHTLYNQTDVQHTKLQEKYTENMITQTFSNNIP